MKILNELCRLNNIIVSIENQLFEKNQYTDILVYYGGCLWSFLSMFC